MNSYCKVDMAEGYCTECVGCNSCSDTLPLLNGKPVKFEKILESVIRFIVVDETNSIPGKNLDGGAYAEYVFYDKVSEFWWVKGHWSSAGHSFDFCMVCGDFHREMESCGAPKLISQSDLAKELQLRLEDQENVRLQVKINERTEVQSLESYLNN
jgi:hypothetical protein